ncbi:hypothetical protein GC102_36540 [Paenibacillus sp. LMG 31460]|uniref:Uncharacterized protein n=1 Tax=Paenibacillus germinis TaxID=2654979 RepID=A0ABX1ZCY1_9BACL|nr:hypothetical protein [Paenibacillus germinis]NOU91198.1 hypothetical protein [Paenibacillus germinis]
MSRPMAMVKPTRANPWARATSPHGDGQAHSPKDGGNSFFVLPGNQIYLLGCHLHAITAFQQAELQISSALPK